MVGPPSKVMSLRPTSPLQAPWKLKSKHLLVFLFFGFVELFHSFKNLIL